MASKKKGNAQVVDRLPVVVVDTKEQLAPSQAFTLPPLAPDALVAGSKVLPAGVLRTIRVDRGAIASNTQRSAWADRYGERNARVVFGKVQPTMVVEENGSKVAYWAVEIRGSAMLKNATEKQSYGCGGSIDSQTAHLVTLAELVVYTAPPPQGV